MHMYILRDDTTENVIFRKRNILYLSFILFFLFGGIGWNIFCYLNSKGFLKIYDNSEFSEIMGRTPMYYAGPDQGHYFSGFFQQQLEKASSDHFPLFAIFSYKKLERFSSKISLSIFPSLWRPLLPIGGNYFYYKKNEILSERPATFSYQNEKNFFHQAGYYNKIIKDNPSIRMVVVPVLYKSDWLVMSNDLELDAKIFRGDRYVREFRSLLDPKIGFFWPGEGLAPSKALSLYFKTDHHLSIAGTYESYCRLVTELFLEGIEMGQYLKPDRWFAIPGIEFRGSDARKAGKFEIVSDELADGSFELPNFRVNINGAYHDGGYSDREKYLKGAIPFGKYVNHYAKYFGGDYGLVEFENPDDHKQNILVIGDSYDNALSRLISSHFKHSFFVDLRFFENSMGTPFNINDFIRSNKIDVVVYFASQNYLLGLSPWENN